LEHGRVAYFHKNGKSKLFIGSADWMLRNLDHRVEVMVPIEDKRLKKELKHILDIQLADNVKARILDNKQRNNYKRKITKDKRVRSQGAIYEYLKALNY